MTADPCIPSFGYNIDEENRFLAGQSVRVCRFSQCLRGFSATEAIVYIIYRLDLPQNLQPIGAKVHGGRRKGEEAIVKGSLCSSVKSITQPDGDKNGKSVQPNPCHLQYNVVSTKKQTGWALGTTPGYESGQPLSDAEQIGANWKSFPGRMNEQYVQRPGSKRALSEIQSGPSTLGEEESSNR